MCSRILAPVLLGATLFLSGCTPKPVCLFKPIARVEKNEAGELRRIAEALKTHGRLLAAELKKPIHPKALARRWQPRFVALYHKLAPLRLDDRVRGLWTDLYRLESALYPAFNMLALSMPLPLTFDNEHQRSAHQWVKLVSRGRDLGRTILHLDSHPDMGGVPHPKKVLEIVAELKNRPGDQAAMSRLKKLVDNINHVIGMAIFVGGAERLLWLKPSWSVIKASYELEMIQGLHRKAAVRHKNDENCPADGLRFYLDPQATDKGQTRRFFAEAARWPDSKKDIKEAVLHPQDKPVEKHFDYLKKLRFLAVDHRTPGLTSKLAKAMLGSRYILSLDLDYFTTNGMKGRGGNPCSKGRVSKDCDGLPRTPAARLKAFERERELIDKRLALFARLLCGLKAAGKRPSVISLADSTILEKSLCRDCISANDFVPNSFISYIKRRALEIIAGVFPEYGMIWRSAIPK